MNFSKFSALFSDDQRPLELAFGYTVARESLYLILFEDRISRLIVDSAGRLLRRVDQQEEIRLLEIVAPHKRFYPNRVHREFQDLCETFGVPLSITNVDSRSEPRFDFPEDSGGFLSAEEAAQFTSGESWVSESNAGVVVTLKCSGARGQYNEPLYDVLLDDERLGRRILVSDMPVEDAVRYFNLAVDPRNPDEYRFLNVKA